MKRRIIVTDCTDPYKNLALEEYLTFHIEEDEVILYLWQNEHTVVIGRNQNPWKECSVEKIKSDGCRLARRLSGGGAVYHDLGNINFTFIARKPNFDLNKQTNVIMDAMKMLGLDCEKSGRNDLTIDGMKFSGHAKFNSGDYCYHHGTIMMYVDCDALSKYLTVSKLKLKSKGVSSVKSRVTNLRDHVPGITKELVNEALIRSFLKNYREGTTYVEITQETPKVPEELLEKYASEKWRYGRCIEFNVDMEERFQWGTVYVTMEVNGGIIKRCGVYSDSLYTEVFPKLHKKLEGLKFDAATISKIDISDICSYTEEKKIAKDVISFIAGSIE